MPALKSYHTFGLDAECQQLVRFASTDEFFHAYDHFDENWLLGEGSNTIFLGDYAGQVLVNNIKGLTHWEDPQNHYLKVGAGENWHQFVTTCVNKGWNGLENLALIPGSVGACPIQNIGAYGVEVGRFIYNVEGVFIADQKPFSFTGEQCQFGYRDSVFKNALAGKVLITHVVFCLPKAYMPVTTYGELASLEQPSAMDIYQAVISVRQKKLPDPAVLGNAGSFFKNPVITRQHYEALQTMHPDVPGFIVDEGTYKVPAAWLIDTLGLKGYSVGGAKSHINQPLVLVNYANATGEDVTQLASHIMQQVKSHFEIELEPEVRLVGHKGLVAL